MRLAYNGTAADECCVVGTSAACMFPVSTRPTHAHIYRQLPSLDKCIFHHCILVAKSSELQISPVQISCTVCEDDNGRALLQALGRGAQLPRPLII
mmetsp:Transcript_28098/g.47737  ORF Transcript_28098/g.47737 Transcript_28098/m.47737 type:complete len:96 (-) Transcript_28098:527-814(-)